MENLVAKVSYLKGLADGLDIDESKPEGKLLVKVVDALKDIAEALDDVIEAHDELEEKVDEIDQDLADVESDIYDDEDDDDDCDCCDFEDEDNPFYEVTCGACGQKLNVSEDVLLEGEIECPNCGELLEFDFSDLFDEDGCCSEDGCTCGCCDVEDEDVE